MAVTPTLMSFPGFLNFLATTGNVKDIATGQIVGAGVSKASNSLIDDIIGPTIAYITNGATLDSHFIVLRRGKKYPYLSANEAVADGALIVKYGNTVYALFNLLIQALVVYFIIGAWKRCLGDVCAWKK